MFKGLKINFPKWKRSKKAITKITLGICAMDKKAKSKPMKEILLRLPEELFEIIYFGDEVILNQPIESWPVVEVLIAFYSTKFPTQKAIEYVKLRKPYMINDLEMEATLKDRRKVYNILQSQGIDVPFHVFLEREDPNKENTLEEFDEYIVVNGVQINKPLVEKPVDAEDHNIYIYYPMSAGGGSKRLFRKINDRSSEFYPMINEVRREGSFIYEEFVITQGTDVKVYTVGTDYGHAEARKSPVVDGRVKRDTDGLEVRYPVILSPKEKDIARKIVQVFRQTVCGFDILRVKEKSFCCDVNGFSFVKNSRKYYEDASQILIEIMLNKLRPEYNSTLSTRVPLVRPVMSRDKSTDIKAYDIKAFSNKDAFIAPTKSRSSTLISSFPDNNSNNITTEDDKDRSNSICISRPPSPAISLVSVESFNDSSISAHLTLNSGIPVRRHDEELRCVIAVIRHADRTPKQKMKIKVTHQKYLDYFHFYAKSPRKDLKVKSKSGLLKFLEITREIISQDDPPTIDNELKKKLMQIKDVLERWEISGINRKLQMKAQKWVDDDNIDSLATEVILILKWGGDLTPLGRKQAENLGTQFRHDMYPDTEGGGVLRLHSTYRHDLKIKASDEGRVMKTAAAFTKGLLELEGQLTPILASLVTVEDKNSIMLDKGGNFEVKDDMDRCKEHLNLLQVDEEMSNDLIEKIAPDCPNSLRKSFFRLGNPLKTLQRIHYLIKLLCEQLEILNERYGVDDASDISKELLLNTKELNTVMISSPDKLCDEGIKLSDSIKIETETCPKLYLSETFCLILDRWQKLDKDFYSSKSGKYDLTKVPDVYDMIRYDLLHNSHLNLKGIDELFKLSSAFENAVVPQEYGVDSSDKRYIGSKVCSALIEKIKYDLETSKSMHDDMHYKLDHSHADDLRINSLERCVRTRLYFTSESHLHTLLNVLRYSGEDESGIIEKEGLDLLNEISELSYLTQIVFRLFEDCEKSAFHCELSFSPGAIYNDPNSSDTAATAPYSVLCRCVNGDTLLNFLQNAIELSKLPREEVDLSFDNPDNAPLSGSTLKAKCRRSTSISVSIDDIGTTSDKWESPLTLKLKKASITLPTINDNEVIKEK